VGKRQAFDDGLNRLFAGAKLTKSRNQARQKIRRFVDLTDVTGD
jgi:hypothetical protein